MFDRPQVGELAILVQPVLTNCRQPPGNAGRASVSGRRRNTDSAEFAELARAAGAEIAGQLRAPLKRIDPGCFLGSGKIAEIQTNVATSGADMVMINHALSAVQERGLERSLQCRVIDRTTLILDIFAQRARSHEGKLQVELAQLRYLSTRLVRGWTHLERQKGGIGLRGPGETQLETDRRLVAGRIRSLNAQLEKVAQQRDQTRRARERRNTKVVTLVGYTNAGKSTLFNALTRADSFVADQLFATLDTSARRMGQVSGETVVLVDTVGFVTDLPHELVAAFRATLSETRDADLLLHIIDVSDAELHQHRDDVLRVLTEIGAADVPRLVVFNKIDVDDGVHGETWRDSVGVSATVGTGVADLRKAVLARLSESHLKAWVTLPHGAGRLRAALYRSELVAEESWDADGSAQLYINAPKAKLEQICATLGSEAEVLQPLVA